MQISTRGDSLDHYLPSSKVFTHLLNRDESRIKKMTTEKGLTMICNAICCSVMKSKINNVNCFDLLIHSQLTHK